MGALVGRTPRNSAFQHSSIPLEQEKATTTTTRENAMRKMGWGVYRYTSHFLPFYAHACIKYPSTCVCGYLALRCRRRYGPNPGSSSGS